MSHTHNRRRAGSAPVPQHGRWPSSGTAKERDRHGTTTSILRPFSDPSPSCVLPCFYHACSVRAASAMMVIDGISCADDVMHASSPPAETATGSTIGNGIRRWHAHAMLMFRQLQHGCGRMLAVIDASKVDTVCGPRRTPSAARGSIRTSNTLPDCPTGATGSSAALGATSTSRCRGVEVFELVAFQPLLFLFS